MSDPAHPKSVHVQPRLGRRAFLSALGAVACGTAQPATVPPASPPATPVARRPRSVVIVGGGLAGLATARKLVKAGLDVQVLEAEPRVGGRIRTVRDGFIGGQYVELGARHVVSDPLMVALCDELRLERFSPFRDPRAAQARRVGILSAGVRRSVQAAELPDEDAQLSAAERSLSFPARLTHYFPEALRLTPQELGWDSDLRELDGVSAADHLRRQGATPAFLAFIESALVPGDSIEQSSALSIMRDAASFRRELELPHGDGRLVGGTDRLPMALAAELGSRVQLEAKVRRISQRAEGVGVEYEVRGERRTLQAERVVCALPYSALASIELPPSISQGKRQAIAAARMSSVTRVWLQCARRAWYDVGESGRVETDTLLGDLREETDLAGEPGVLGAYLTGANARRWLEIPGAARVPRARTELAAALPSGAALDGACGVFSWDEVATARGGYSWFAPGELTAAGGAYAAPEGRLHFAGDHVSSRPGFMHGALESVERVVNEVLAARD